MIISSIAVKRIGLLFPRAGNGKRNRQQGYGRNTFFEERNGKVQKQNINLHHMKIIKWLKNKKAFFFTQQIDMEITLHPIETSFQFRTLCGAMEHEN